MLEVTEKLRRLSQQCLKIEELDSQKSKASQALKSELESRVKTFTDEIRAL